MQECKEQHCKKLFYQQQKQPKGKFFWLFLIQDIIILLTFAVLLTGFRI